LIFFGLFFFANGIALCCGILYLIKGYSKQAAALYKYFMRNTIIYASITIQGGIHYE